MKTYNVIIERNGEICSTFEVVASNYVEAMRLARFNRKLSRVKGVIRIHLNK